MSRIRVCVAGATGWVGRSLSPAIVHSDDLSLVAAVSPSLSGADISDVLGIKDFSLRISGSVEEALKNPTDVLIDFTKPDVVKSNVLSAVSHGVHVVVGTSGLSDSDYEEIDAAARQKGVGVIAAGNFAISAALMLHFASVAARYMSSWEIVDYASWTKVDSPSGMARELAYRLSRIGDPEVKVPPDSINGPRESRGASLNGNRVHSIRLPGQIIGAEVIFGKPDEKLYLKYDGGSGAGPYVEGVILAVRRIKEMTGLTRGLDKLLDL